jgi:hypothetical protein
MRDTEDLLRTRAATLAEELATAAAERRPAEWLEELLLTTLLEVRQAERRRCAELAAERARIWEASAARAARAWPEAAVAEARARRTEALAIADRILGPEPASGAGHVERAG